MESAIEDVASFQQYSTNYGPDLNNSTNGCIKGDFYSVFVPSDVRQKGLDVSNYVYQDKTEAMKMVKKAKKARFKHFDSYTEALKFATIGIIDVVKNESSSQIGNERMSPFKGPKPQELVKLRKAIEVGDLDLFRDSVWDNPRYLISNGDTPSILQEGVRYNALHAAAKSKNAAMTELILNTISNPKFIKLLYGDDCFENGENRIRVLLDLYLNTPDKGINETPLHFAAKFGAADVVEVLVSFPQCDKSLRNKYGQTPAMIICDRCDTKDEVLTKKISALLENSYYVPVLRAEDNSLAPLIGEPFSPGRSHSLSRDPMSPRLEIHAYAGPMNREGAEQFRRVWKTPPRTSTPIKKTRDDSLDSVISLRYTDTAKGLERLGQRLANKFDVTWKEYWPFLECFIDIASNEGLVLFENYLAGRFGLVVKSSSHPPSPDTPDDGKKSMSTIADLCMHMQNCKLNDSSSVQIPDFNQFWCVEKACNVFANRIACEINNRMYDSFQVQVSLLQVQTKQVELLALSYMDDSRFDQVNFALLHSRLGLLTGQKLCFFIQQSKRLDYIQSINRFISECAKAFDCFSSDDEANSYYSRDSKPTSSKKQLICLMQNVANNFTNDTEPKLELNNENACRDAWLRMKECNCVFRKKTRKGFGLNIYKNRFSSIKNDTISRKLLFNDNDDLNDKKNVIEGLPSEEDDDDDDDFFTPPSTPPSNDYEMEEDDYSDAQILSEVFIEGDEPTKTDCDVYKALNLADCIINPEKFPNIYRWYHNIGLYTISERESWPCAKPVRENLTNSNIFNTPPQKNQNKSIPHQHHQHTPTSNSWLRITGFNSPRASLQGKINM